MHVFPYLLSTFNSDYNLENGSLSPQAVNCANNRIEVGPWGGSGGANPWSIIPDGGRITRINIRSGAVVDAISFGYTQRGSSYNTDNFGGHNGRPYTVSLVNFV
ncbi:putative jacalin-like lectin domain-containing protein [Helianthus anomalus]